MATEPISISDFRGGWNANEPTTIDDNQLAEAINWRYDENNLLRTRFGSDTFGTAIPVSAGENVLSIHSYKESDGTVQMVAHAGTVFYSYNEGTGAWVSQLTGLTAVRGQFAVYKDICYYVNGTDFVSWDGTTAAQEATPEKVKYLIVKNDIIYGGGETANPSTLYYSDANPASIKIAFANSDPIEEDNGQIITGLGNIGNAIYVFKEKSVYRFDVSGPSYNEIDQPIGCLGFRSIIGVDNNMLFQGQDGDIYNASVLENATSRTKAFPLTNDLTPYTKDLTNLANTAAFEYKKLNNVYFAVDPDNTGVPTEILVLNTKVSSIDQNRGVWTRYTNIFANDFTVFEDSSGVEHLLIASAFGGQVMEIETGSDDDGSAIEIDLTTKAYEFGDPTILKFINNIDCIFHATNGATFQFDAVGEEGVFAGGQVNVSSTFVQSGVLGVNPLGVVPLGGEEVSSLGRFKERLPAYDPVDRVQIRLTDLLESHSLILEKLNIQAVLLGRNIFPQSNIL